MVFSFWKKVILLLTLILSFFLILFIFLKKKDAEFVIPYSTGSISFEFDSKIPGLFVGKKYSSNVNVMLKLLKAMNIDDPRKMSFYGKDSSQLNPNNENLSSLKSIHFIFYPLSERKPEGYLTVIQSHKFDDR